MPNETIRWCCTFVVVRVQSSLAEHASRHLCFTTRESLFWVTFQTSAASISSKAAFCYATIDVAMQCKSGALVERWSLPPTPCDAFAQVAQDDLSFLPFGCDDVDFPNRHSHADLRNHSTVSDDAPCCTASAVSLPLARLNRNSCTCRVTV